MERVLILICAVIFSVHFAPPPEISVSSMVEFKRCREPAKATSVRQYYRAINAISADPAINGTLALLS
ncbi:MAG TPA: hypothetical protein VJ719_02155 [Chthoniobacterales bacterium]|nr:hypothetical protein [Chthoniobacterales bacterium]